MRTVLTHPATAFRQTDRRAAAPFVPTIDPEKVATVLGTGWLATPLVEMVTSSHLLASEGVLRQKGVEYYETSRGGDITYHGPGQIVGYPILNLGAIRRDVVWYVRMLEEAMIRATSEFGITAERVAGKTGIWVKSGDTEEKLAAIGVHISRWVTSHGFAYNVSTDLRYFDLIVPCGIADRKATLLEKLLGRTVEQEEVAPRIARHLGELFGREMQEASKKELLERLEHAERFVTVSA